jgi:Flp pilus assembly protein TadB
MTGPPLLVAVPAALLAGTAVGLLVAPRFRPAARAAPAERHHDERALLLRLRVPLVALAFVGAWAFLGGVVGAVAGSVGAAVAWRVLGRAESPGDRRRREELERDLPTAVHLIGACLTAGADTATAFDSVCAALPGAVADELRLVRHRLALGADPAAVWHGLARHPQLRPLGRALERSHRSGASVRVAVEALASELSGDSRARTDALARSVEVRAAAPLGVCFLPAFVLLGVVPMVVGVFSAMRLFG